MSVIVELRVGGDDFELGRVLDPPEGVRVEIQQPGGDGPVPFWVAGRSPDLEQEVARRDGVEDVRTVEGFEDRTLYALEWDGDGDRLLAAAEDAGADLLECRGEADDWQVGLRFPDEQSLSGFRDWCGDNDLDPAIEHHYEPTGCGPYDLTDRQHTTLERAVQSGYYDIPRTTTTQELADELGVSDQAVTERLRRAITSLAEGTVLADDR
jgi:predicted DNA binding protein